MTNYDQNGLSPQQVEESRREHGTNVLTPVKKDPVWKMFLEKFRDPIIKILLFAAVLSLVAGAMEGHYAETVGIIVAILLATGVSFWFEYDAMKRFEILNKVNDDTPVKVRREGQVVEIPKRDVVVGDIVILGSGDEVPADGKLLDSVSLKVNESTLTGEPETDKSHRIEDIDEEEGSTYAANEVMKGTTVSEGSGVIAVTAVGDSTEYGKVARQSTVKSEEETPLNIQLNKLSKLIGKIGGWLAGGIFAILIVKGIFFGGGLLEGDWLHTLTLLLGYFMVAVAIMVMAVPEGLPMSITLSLAMSMRRMLKTNNLVRKMHACETMGAVTVICTDKTGTLTRNQMSVHEIKEYRSGDTEILKVLMAVNSTAFIDNEGKVIGNPTEGALLLWLQDQGEDYRSIRNEVRIIDQLSFTTERKYMATIAETGGRRYVFVKGAPEIVGAMSRDTGRKEEIKETLLAYQHQAMRTLGFAFSETTADKWEKALSDGGLDFIAIAAISDPIREEVPGAVAQCRDAGIAIKIVTGDTAPTARQIAREIGLWDDSTDDDQSMITGPEFEKLSDSELLERIDKLKIMARARPLDKQRLVRLLQQNGEVVAVTGDGTNDAPALNFAQVGLSMGSGTSVAKQASDITLLDDSFKSIATAVMWGRSLYKNIQRFVLFQLTVNFTAMIVVFIGSVFGNELPLTVTQILWVNIIMDTFAALALASLPPNEKVMQEKPRRQTDFIITKQMMKWIVGMGVIMIAVLLGFLASVESTINNLTAFFTIFVMMHFWNLFNARSFGADYKVCTSFGACKTFYLVLLAIIAGQVLIVTYGGEVFRTEPLQWLDWGAIVLFTSLIMAGGGLARSLRRKRLG